MMLKILVFAYAQKIYSCRQIAASLHENVTFMWLSGGNTPDFRTINRFRSGPLKETLEKLFTSLTEHLIQEGHVSKEQKRKYKKDKFNKDNWPYDPESDTYFCPQDREFNVYLEREKATASGYKYKEKLYAGLGCRGCPERRFCCRGSGDRRIQRRDKWEQQKTEVRDFLLSEEGVRMRSLRPIEPETVFGQVKNNMGFKRFHLRGKDKVTAEWGLVSMAHNLRKLANIRE